MVWARDFGCELCLYILYGVKVLCILWYSYVGLMLVMGSGMVPVCEGAMLAASLVVCVERCLWSVD